MFGIFNYILGNLMVFEFQKKIDQRKLNFIIAKTKQKDILYN